MRMSALFGSTLREAPAGAASAGEALLARGGFVRDGAGGRVVLPLGARVMARVEQAALRELEAEGAQAVVLAAGGSDPRDVAALARTEIRSWRQLPRVLLSRGPLRLTAFALEAEEAGLTSRLARLEGALQRTASAAGVAAELVEGEGGRALVAPDASGETELARCGSCGYAALASAARFARAPAAAEEPRPLRKVATPGCTSMEDLAKFLGVGPEKTAKAVFQVADEERFVFAVVRGDREVSEPKLRAAVQAARLRPATAEEIRTSGAVAGYASPVGLPGTTLVVADPEVTVSPNLVAGANEVGFHLLNTNIPRDYTPALVTDIAAAPPGAGCPGCGRALLPGRAFLLGRARLLPALPGQELPRYQDAGGKERAVFMAELELCPGRILSAAAQAHHDERGVTWPGPIAPFDVHVVSLGGAGTDALREAERVCGELERGGRDTLLDDRDESPGVKFADADLVGIPVRITVSARSLAAGGVEVKRRDAPAKVVTDAGRAVAEILAGRPPA